MTRKCLLYAPWMGLCLVLAGCHSPSVTAVSLNPEPCGPECGSFWGVLHHCLKEKEEGIPFYLPKPLLIVAKNFRNIEEPRVGLTDGAPIPNKFDDQAKYADLNGRFAMAVSDAPGTTTAEAKTSAEDPAPTPAPENTATSAGKTIHPTRGAQVTPGTVASDGLDPNVFYTYQIVFVPDLTQKYGLKIKGGVGEIRAAMNLVNGWQFTGIGPFYMKDSSTAQNVLASGITANLTGRGIADVVKSVADLSKAVKGTKSEGEVETAGTKGVTVAQAQRVVESIKTLNPEPMKPIQDYAEIYVYEAFVGPDGMMDWRQINPKSSFSRHWLSVNSSTKDTTTASQTAYLPNGLQVPVSPPAPAPGGTPQTPPSEGVPPAPSDDTPGVGPPDGGNATPSPRRQPPPFNQPSGAAGASTKGTTSSAVTSSAAAAMASSMMASDPALERSIIAGTLGIPNPSVVGNGAGISGGVLAQDAAAPSPPTNQLSLNQFFGVRGAPNGATTPTPGTLRSLLNPLQKHHRAQAKQETRVVAGAQSLDLTGQGQGTPVNPNVPFVPSISAAGTAAPASSLEIPPSSQVSPFSARGSQPKSTLSRNSATTAGGTVADPIPLTSSNRQ